MWKIVWKITDYNIFKLLVTILKDGLSEQLWYVILFIHTTIVDEEPEVNPDGFFNDLTSTVISHLHLILITECLLGPCGCQSQAADR